jgi:hypothetical protein
LDGDVCDAVVAVEFCTNLIRKFLVGDFPVMERVEVGTEGVQLKSPTAGFPCDGYVSVVDFLDEWAKVLDRRSS